MKYLFVGLNNFGNINFKLYVFLKIDIIINKK